VRGSQQPVEQLAGVHTQVPLLHSVPAGQVMQAAPEVPQAWAVLPARHVVPSQQPLAQLAGVHTHDPFWHSVPPGQLTHAAPPVPQS
jgi:hypothetical protein